MNYETGISSLSKLILLDAIVEEDDKFVLIYSYHFHVTMTFDNIGCVGSVGKFLWNNSKLPHSRHLLPPTHIFLKNISLGFLLHNIVETKSRNMVGRGSPC